MIGGIVMGIGQALLEEGSIDPRDGRVTNANLAEYVVAVNADVPDIQTIDVGVPDYQATALGGKRWASSASSVSPQPSAMRSFTQRGSGCATCRSHWRS